MGNMYKYSAAMQQKFDTMFTNGSGFVGASWKNQGQFRWPL